MSLASANIDLESVEQLSAGSVQSLSVDVDTDFMRDSHGIHPSGKTISIQPFGHIQATDDLMVVSDDSPPAAYFLGAKAMSEMHDYFARIEPVEPETHSILTGIRSDRVIGLSDKESWRSFLGLLATNIDQSSYRGLPNRPSAEAWRFSVPEAIAAHVLIDPIRSEQALAGASLQSIANEYYTILDSALEPRGYEAQELYEDPLGGYVCDFLRDRDRVTSVVSKAAIQLLFCANDAIKSTMFANSAASKLELTRFVEKHIQ